VTTFDLRGCGSSDRREDGYDLPSLADDLAWLCAEIGVSRPVVIGHSLGAMIAIELAARHPSLPAAVIADDPGPINPSPEIRSIYEGFAMELEGPTAKPFGVPGSRTASGRQLMPSRDIESWRRCAPYL
jgi:pimeloyl-ACP methyl ester carboxylesterase